MPACASAGYPRTLPNVLSGEHRRHLASVYFKHVHKQSGRTYYNLLRTMVAADDAEYGATHAALAAVRASVEAALGDRFVVINDFFSYRRHRTRAANPRRCRQVARMSNAPMTRPCGVRVSAVDSSSARLFPSWHQDYEFWLTGGCANLRVNGIPTRAPRVAAALMPPR